MSEAKSKSQVADEILAGALDLNVLAGPEPHGVLRFDGLDTARHAQEAGLGGFLLVNEHYPTGAQAQTLNRVYPGLTVYGAVTLNGSIGGMNARAVEAAAGSGAAAVMMPTQKGEAVLDPDGTPARELAEVLDAAARHGLLVASGGLSHSDTEPLFRAASARGVSRMLASHRATQLSSDECEDLISTGAYVEHVFASCMPLEEALPVRVFAQQIRAATVQASVLTSGFGQWNNPPPAEGLRMAIAALLGEGFTPDELETMVKRNPAKLLGIES